MVRLRHDTQVLSFLNLARFELGNLKLKTALKYLLMANDASATFLDTFSKTMAILEILEPFSEQL